MEVDAKFVIVRELENGDLKIKNDIEVICVNII